ncbi:MAG: hypothetical protein U0791_04295 [Gemmataceae bacterium]
MRRNLVSLVLFVCALAAVAGCTDKRFKHYYKPKEECVLPPPEGADPRFDKPPAAEYRARVKPTEDKSTLMNASKMGGGGGRPGGF